MTPLWIDTHCHLDADEFAADRDQVVAEAVASGLALMVVPAVCPEHFAGVRAVCARYPLCRPAYGIHPLYLPADPLVALGRVKEWLGREPAVAVGEIGLDHDVPGLDRAAQRDLFEAQLCLARDFDLPVLLHVRHAVDAVLASLRRVRPRGGIAHAFNGSRQQAEAFLAAGFRLGLGGALTQARATRLRALARDLPLEALVLETDAPDMSPAWRRGERNAPGELPRIGAEIALLREISPEELARACALNARAVLPRC